MTTADVRYPRRALAVGAAGVFMALLDATIVNIAFPSIRASFPGTSVAGLSWVLNAYNVVFAAFLVPAGRYADVFGRRRLFLIGLATYTVASTFCAAAPSAAVLVSGRVVQALGAALVVPASLGLFLPFFAVERRTTAVAMWAAAGGVAAGIGPSVGGLLVHIGSWRWVFLVNIPIGLLTIQRGRRTLKETREPGGQLPDPSSALLLAACVGTLALAIVKGPDWGWISAKVGLSLGATGVLAWLFLQRTRRAAASGFGFELFRVRSFAVANAATFLFAMGVYAVLLANVLFLTSIWHYSGLQAGLATTPTPLISGLVAAPAGRLATAVGDRAVIVAGALIYASGVAFYALFVGFRPSFVRDWLPGALMAGIGIGLVFPVLSSAALAAVPTKRFATATAINVTARQIGAVLGVAVLVAILSSASRAALPQRFDSGWVVAMSLGIATAILVGGFWRLPATGSSDAAIDAAHMI